MRSRHWTNFLNLGQKKDSDLSNPVDKLLRVPRGLAEQGNKGQIAKGTREHEPVFGNAGTIEPLQVFLRGDSDGRSNKEKLWENVNTGDF